MKALDRYVVRSLISRTGGLLVVFTSLVVGGQLGIYIGQGVPPDALLPVIPTAVLLALPMALPLSVSTAILMVIGAMARSGEFQALSTAGVDPRRVVLRMWPFVLLAAVVVGILAHTALPLAMKDLRARKGQMIQAAIAPKVINKRPIYDGSGVAAWAEHVEGRRLRDVYIRQDSPERALAAYAPEATWRLVDGGVDFQLTELRMIELRSDGTLLTGEAAATSYRPPDRQRDTEPDAMWTPQVLALIRDKPDRKAVGSERARYNNARLTAQLRWYLPFGVIAYALLAAGIALAFALAEGLAALMVVIVVVTVATYPAIGYVKSNADLVQAHPGFLLWLPGILIAAIGWWMLSHPQAASDSLGRPIDGIRRLARGSVAVALKVIRRVRGEQRSDEL